MELFKTIIYLSLLNLYTEKDLIALVKNVKFRKVKHHFQKKLDHDIKMIRTSDKTMTFSDKTNNVYRLSKDQYIMVLNNSITSTYKKIK